MKNAENIAEKYLKQIQGYRLTESKTAAGMRMFRYK